MRGDIEKIMIAIRNFNGNVEEKTISEFANKNQVECYSQEMLEFGDFEIEKILPLYELIELEMKEEIMMKLP